MKLWSACSLCFVLAALALAGPAAAHEEGPSASAPDVSQLLARLEADPHPEDLSGGSHFVVSDERRLDVFRPAVTGRGGTLVGVGTDQIYLLAGWARSDVVVAMDFDQVVVDLHAVYALLLLRAATPDEFVAWWRPERAAAVRHLIAEGVRDPAERARVRAAFDLSRELVAVKLASTRKLQARHGATSYLSDQSQYDHVAGLVRAGRVRAVRGDLTAQTTMRQIGELARAVGAPVRVLYLSNAEKYFPYSPQYRDNILGLPMDARSIVLRTVGWGPDDAARDDPFYIYVQQSGDDFRAWLERRRPANVRPIVRSKKKTTVHGLYVVEGPRDPAQRVAKKRVARPRSR